MRRSKNPTSMLPLIPWKFRTTVAKVGDRWELISLSQELNASMGLTDDIPGLLMRTTILTLMHRRYTSLDEVAGFSVVMDVLPPDDEGGEFFQREEAIPELHGGYGPEAIEGPVYGLSRDHLAGGLVGNPESVVVNEQELSMASTSNALKNGCAFLGLSQNGSKARLYNRICEYLRGQYDKDVDHAALQLQREAGPRARVQAGVDPPSDEMMLQHAATHLPYQPWCEICVQTKGKDDPSHGSVDVSLPE